MRLESNIWKQVKNTALPLQVQWDEWKKTKCTIITDGWYDKKRRTMIYFLVNSPKDIVFLPKVRRYIWYTQNRWKSLRWRIPLLERKGKTLLFIFWKIMQQTTKLLVKCWWQRGKTIFWTPCAAFCIDLMLEDCEKKITVHEETIPTRYKNYDLYLFKNFFNFSVATFHGRKRLDEDEYYSFCHILLDSRVPSWEGECFS